MKVLLTGGYGFLGSHFRQSFERQEVHSLGRGDSNTISVDLSKTVPTLNDTYDLVIHCAGKAHSIPRSIEEEKIFFEVNHKGTINLLRALDKRLPHKLVFISTIAVYGRETGKDINETHPLNGSTPYALSKIKAEEEVMNWSMDHQVPMLILRLPLIAGSNPPGNLGKMIEGIKTRKYLSINHGKARRSVVMASDIAELIKNSESANGIYNLTDGYHPSFREIENVICSQLNKKLPISIPGWLGQALGLLGNFIPKSPINSDTINKMSQDLTFSDQKARHEINWSPSNTLENFKIF